ALLAFEQHLRQERPHRDWRRIHVLLVLGKGDSFLVESLLDFLFRQRVLEGQVGMLHERGQHQTKALWESFGILVKWHETFLGLNQSPNPQGRSHGTRIYAKEGSRAKISWRWAPGPARRAQFL